MHQATADNDRGTSSSGPATMRALGLTERPSSGSFASALRWVDVPIPEPRKGEVQVRVAYAGLKPLRSWAG